MEKIIGNKNIKILAIALIALFITCISTLSFATGEETENTIDIGDMKLNTIVYFKGQTYSAFHYKCNNERYAKEIMEEETAGIVWVINRKPEYNSVVLQLSNGLFRTVPVSQVTRIREGKYLNFEVSDLEQLTKGELKLNIKIDGEKNDVEILNGANVKIATDGAIVLGMENGVSQLKINAEGQEPIDIFIIKDAKGNIKLDIDQGHISAEVEAVIAEKIKAGADVALDVKDGKIVLAGGGKVSDETGGTTYVGADGKLSYDIKDPDADVKVQVKVDALNNTVVDTGERNTGIVKLIKFLFAKIKSLV